MPLAYSALPVATGQDGVRAVVGAALLVAMAVAVRRQLTVGMGFGLLVLGGLEISALGSYGSSLAPAALFGAAGLAIRLSTPPRLSASDHTRVRATASRA